MNRNYSKVIVMTIGTYKIAYNFSDDLLDELIQGKSLVANYESGVDAAYHVIPRNYTVEVLSREEFNRLTNPPQLGY